MERAEYMESVVSESPKLFFRPQSCRVILKLCPADTLTHDEPPAEIVQNRARPHGKRD